jgi:phosphatidylserine/phosphatidylglycerophosphate/cardiolipin synthase-like enzyme
MTDVRFLKNGAEAFPAMFKAVVLATSTIALEMYYIADDRTGRQFHAQLI